MNRLRSKLIAVFLLATLAPLGATLWVTKSLFEQSLRLAGQSQAQLDEVSRSLETTGREFYQRACASLKSDAEAGRIAPVKIAAASPAVQEFLESGEPGISLRRLVEIFSRPPRNQQQWLESQGPLRLQDL